MFNAATKTAISLLALGALAACGDANGVKEASRLVDEAKIGRASCRERV